MLPWSGCIWASYNQFFIFSKRIYTIFYYSIFCPVSSSNTVSRSDCRNFTFVFEVFSCLEKVLISENAYGQIFNIGSPDEISINVNIPEETVIPVSKSLALTQAPDFTKYIPFSLVVV